MKVLNRRSLHYCNLFSKTNLKIQEQCCHHLGYEEKKKKSEKLKHMKSVVIA
jgi:hypothetical protein